MIDEFVNLYAITIRELLLAGHRIGRQSGLVLRARLQLRRWRRRARVMRRRLHLGRKKTTEPLPSHLRCLWVPQGDGPHYWVCFRCHGRALAPNYRIKCKSPATEPMVLRGGRHQPIVKQW